ncbi:MAG: hypothetical protein HY774_08675 [Acidobacteria bacterium]|nr:hypothetical protein [Acidobacteriota bacterium]
MNFPKTKSNLAVCALVILLLIGVGCGTGEDSSAEPKDQNANAEGPSISPSQSPEPPQPSLGGENDAQTLVESIRFLQSQKSRFTDKQSQKQSITLITGSLQIFSNIKEGNSDEQNIKEAKTYLSESNKLSCSTQLDSLFSELGGVSAHPEITTHFKKIQEIFKTKASVSATGDQEGLANGQPAGSTTAESGEKSQVRELLELKQAIADMKASVANQPYFHWLEQGGTFLVALLIGLGGGVVLGRTRRPAMNDGPPPNDPAREKQEMRDQLQQLMNEYSVGLKTFIGEQFTQQEKKQAQSWNELKDIQESHANMLLQVKKSLDDNRGQPSQPPATPSVVGNQGHSEKNRIQVQPSTPTFPSGTVEECLKQVNRVVLDVGPVNGQPQVLSTQTNQALFSITRFFDSSNRQPHLLALPNRDRLMAQHEFSYYYTEFYSCSEIRTGEIVITKPALVEEYRGEYRLIQKGVIEIRQ